MRFTMLLAALLWVGAASAYEQAYVEMAAQGGENVSYAYADVLRANPTYEIVPASNTAAECGADVDGDGSGDGTTQAVDDVLVVGASAQRWQECRVSQADSEERRISGYDVEYRYKGQVYLSHMDYDPGNKLRIRVTVAPAD